MGNRIIDKVGDDFLDKKWISRDVDGIVGRLKHDIDIAVESFRRLLCQDVGRKSAEVDALIEIDRVVLGIDAR